MGKWGKLARKFMPLAPTMGAVMNDRTGAGSRRRAGTVTAVAALALLTPSVANAAGFYDFENLLATPGSKWFDQGSASNVAGGFNSERALLILNNGKLGLQPEPADSSLAFMIRAASSTQTNVEGQLQCFDSAWTKLSQTTVSLLVTLAWRQENVRLPRRDCRYLFFGLFAGQGVYLDNVQLGAASGPQPPAAPSSLTASSFAEHEVSLQWSAVPEAAGYEVGRGGINQAPPNLTLIATVPGNLTEFTWTDCQETGESVHFYARTVAANGAKSEFFGPVGQNCDGSSSAPPQPEPEPEPEPTRDPAIWPFTRESPWNTPIAATAEYSGPTDACTVSLKSPDWVGVNVTQYSHPVQQAAPTDPLTNVYTDPPWDVKRLRAVVRIPALAKPSAPSNGDRHMHVSEMLCTDVAR
jgi:hypothetical protein